MDDDRQRRLGHNNYMISHRQVTIIKILALSSLSALAIGLFVAAVCYLLPWLFLLSYAMLGMTVHATYRLLHSRHVTEGAVYSALMGVLLGYLCQVTVVAIQVVMTHGKIATVYSEHWRYRPSDFRPKRCSQEEQGVKPPTNAAGPADRK
jgi:hypothetical protein